jgi:hypothetical protein
MRPQPFRERMRDEDRGHVRIRCGSPTHQSNAKQVLKATHPRTRGPVHGTSLALITLVAPGDQLQDFSPASLARAFLCAADHAASRLAAGSKPAERASEAGRPAGWQSGGGAYQMRNGLAAIVAQPELNAAVLAKEPLRVWNNERADRLECGPA